VKAVQMEPERLWRKESGSFKSGVKGRGSENLGCFSPSLAYLNFILNSKFAF